jgi:hypothetical protein
VIDIQQYEGAAGEVDDDDFGPIFIMHRETQKDVVTARAGVRDRVLEVTELVSDPDLTQDDVVAMIVLVYLFHFTDDYYRGEVDRVSLAWADGSKLVTFNYPAKP